jgi:transposase
MKEYITIGMDLGDKYHIVVILDNQGNEIECRRVLNTKAHISRFFSKYSGAKVAIESGTHSPWISRLLEDLDCIVLVGNPYKLRVIWDSNDKSDERDARILAMICRLEPRLLWPIQHRGIKAHTDLEIIKSRDTLVQSRTKVINCVRSKVKGIGERLPKCSAASFSSKVSDLIPEPLQSALMPLMDIIQEMTYKIKELDKHINRLILEEYPEAESLLQVQGVGPVTALAYILTIEDPSRFTKSRMVGPYLGLTPRRDQSGDIDKQLPITKAGNAYLRKLLVGCAHYIIGPFGPDSNLRRYGVNIAARGGKNARKRAAVAVARKLSVLLHRLWVTKQEYDPLYSMINLKKAA